MKIQANFQDRGIGLENHISGGQLRNRKSLTRMRFGMPIIGMIVIRFAFTDHNCQELRPSDGSQGSF